MFARRTSGAKESIDGAGTTTLIPAIVCLLTGALLSLAWPEPDLSFLAWVGLAPFLDTVRAGSARRGALLGWLFGLGFFGALLIWISLVGWVAWGVLVLLQSAYIALFGAAYATVAVRAGPLLGILAAPVIWVAVDYFRGLWPVGGFTWGQLAQSQHDYLWMLRPAALGGAWLVTFTLVVVNSVVVHSWRSRARLQSSATWAAAAVILIAAPALLPANAAGGRPVRVAIVQGNLPRTWTGTSFDKDLRILANHSELTEDLAGDDVDLVVWPESSVGLDFERVSEVADEIVGAVRTAGAPLVFGGNLDVDENHYRVMAFEVAPDGEVVDRYQKTHLVPFGEYVPGRAALDWIPMLDQVPRDAVPAREPVVFEVAGGAVAPVISFEGDFGSLVRGRVAAGGRLLVIATNTSTWGESSASAQHVAFAQLRAAENGVWVVHAALSGISAFVAPDGEIVASTPLWTKTTLQQTVRFADGITFYARVGDWLPLACLLGAIGLVAAGVVAKIRR